jgi:hypothetical protein
MKSTYRLTAFKQAAPDLLERTFVSEGPDKLWLADITYERWEEDFL